MIVRQMQIEDIPQLEVLYQQFWGERSDVAKMKSVFEKIDGQPQYILLSAVEGDKLLGSVTGIVCPEMYVDCRPFLVLENMVVDQNSRKKGVGKALLHALEEIAKERDCRQIILVTESDRHDAAAFYKACGFGLDNIGFKKKLY